MRVLWREMIGFLFKSLRVKSALSRSPNLVQDYLIEQFHKRFA